MRQNERLYDAFGRCVRISYLGPKDQPIGDIEHLVIAQYAGRQKVSIRSLGGEFTFAQVETIARGMLSMIRKD